MGHVTRRLHRTLAAGAVGILLATTASATVLAQGSPLPSPMATAPAGPVGLLRAGVRDPAPQVPAQDLAALVTGNTGFALDLYRQVAEGADNVVLGPLSVSVAMAMQHTGTRGETAEQIERAMHFPLPGERLDAAFDVLGRSLATMSGPGLTSSLVNQLFGQASYAFEAPFLATLDARYGAPLATLDFGADPEAARAAINAWVAEQTAGRIDELLPSGAIHELTRLVLVNAMYLDAAWADPFNAALTEPRRFRLASGDRVPVPTMARVGHDLVARGEGYRAVELPYVGDRLAMLVIVPDDLADFEGRLSPDRLDRIVDRLEEEYVDLTVPTFGTASTVDLVEPLRELGISDAFDPDLADLSGMTAEPRVHVDAAVHQAFITVGEAGTQAGAATAIGDSAAAMPTTLHVNRPFLWLIRDRETGSILYLGRVTDPRAADQ